jgi:hypothetical protein
MWSLILLDIREAFGAWRCNQAGRHRWALPAVWSPRLHCTRCPAMRDR